MPQDHHPPEKINTPKQHRNINQNDPDQKAVLAFNIFKYREERKMEISEKSKSLIHIGAHARLEENHT